MADERPIKMHVDEEMRAHIEFVLRRYMNDLSALRDGLKLHDNRIAGPNIQDEIDLTHMCLKEAMEAGT